MKTLYEITNGFMGCSYVRVYALASDETMALIMAELSFSSCIKQNGGNVSYCTNLKAVILKENLQGDSFCTKPSDEGWI